MALLLLLLLRSCSPRAVEKRRLSRCLVLAPSGRAFRPFLPQQKGIYNFVSVVFRRVCVCVFMHALNTCASAFTFLYFWKTSLKAGGAPYQNSFFKRKTAHQCVCVWVRVCVCVKLFLMKKKKNEIPNLTDKKKEKKGGRDFTWQSIEIICRKGGGPPAPPSTTITATATTTTRVNNQQLTLTDDYIIKLLSTIRSCIRYQSVLHHNWIE